MYEDEVSCQIYDWFRKGGRGWFPESFVVTNGAAKIQPVPIAVPNADALDFLFSLFRS